MANTSSTKLYKLLSGSITRYEGEADKEGSRKVVTYEANGERAGNLVWLAEKEVKFIGLAKLEEVHGNVEGAPEPPTEVVMSTPATSAPQSSGNPAVDRVLAKKAAESK